MQIRRGQPQTKQGRRIKPRERAAHAGAGCRSPNGTDVMERTAGVDPAVGVSRRGMA